MLTNNQSNEENTLEYIYKSYIAFNSSKTCRAKASALVIYDEFKGQQMDSVHSLLDANNIYVVKVPPNCTDHFQPMDLAINRSAKEFFMQEICVWYSDIVEQKLIK